MESSRRDLFISMVIDRFILKNPNQITIFPCFTFITKTGVGLAKIAVIFYCFPLEVYFLQWRKTPFHNTGYNFCQ